MCLHLTESASQVGCVRRCLECFVGLGDNVLDCLVGAFRKPRATVVSRRHGAHLNARRGRRGTTVKRRRRRRPSKARRGLRSRPPITVVRQRSFDIPASIHSGTISRHAATVGRSGTGYFGSITHRTPPRTGLVVARLLLPASAVVATTGAFVNERIRPAGRTYEGRLAAGGGEDHFITSMSASRGSVVDTQLCKPRVRFLCCIIVFEGSKRS